MLRISFGACAALWLIGALLTQTADAAQAQKTETQKPVPQPGPQATKVDKSSAPAGVATPPGYVIGADDLLAIRMWGDTQLSVDVVVRPDGKISLPLLNDVQ